MNIAPISFGQHHYNRHELSIPATNAQNFNDEFIPREQHKRIVADKNNNILFSRAMALTAALFLVLTQAHACETKRNSYISEIPYSESISLEEVAEDYNSNPYFLEEYNNIDDYEEVPEVLKIPERQNLLEDKITELTKKYDNDKLTPEQKQAYRQQITDLQNKQDLQNKLAEVYADGKYTYFLLKSNINVEKFKDIFDIKDGRIKAYNKLTDYGWGPYDPDMGTYKDYTKCTLHEGDIIKIPLYNSIED